MVEKQCNERFEKWLDQVNRACGRFSGAALESGFHGSLSEHLTHAIKLSVVEINQARLLRTKQEVTQSNDAWFYTVFQLEGEAVMEQGDRQAVLTQGDITLIDAGRPSCFTYTDGAKQVSLLLPRHLLEQHLRQGEVPCAQRLSAEMPVVRLSHSLLRESMGSEGLSGGESEATLEAIACLLAPALIQHSLPGSKRDRHLQKVMSLIDDHIQSETLRPEWIAAESGMSVRSLYRLFADKGLVVAQYIKNRRLDLCAQALRTASHSEKLAGIGYSWGFADHSHFSTAFKGRFGVSPGEYRKRFQSA
ncbi:transcriptional regulator FeaR [Enterobacter sp. Ap-916]|uniref:transcriptional regulator FeaR n=1 Tax=Enterobacteriaceae TaxID=543 RepID=UPI001420F7E2|nr:MULTISPECIES: transcriptional regulator FeaR [unclassified Enterobacter]NIF57830.1 transcriptional regulator FeaR [Enterobacter sp. Ap-867]NIG28227.1 transcriptional regulator FeaR [Enterobacter sp. Ap-916]